MTGTNQQHCPLITSAQQPPASQSADLACMTKQPLQSASGRSVAEADIPSPIALVQGVLMS